MGLFKTIVISAAVYGAYKFFTETDALGRTRLDEIKDQVPELLNKAKAIKEDLKEGYLPKEY